MLFSVHLFKVRVCSGNYTEQVLRNICGQHNPEAAKPEDPQYVMCWEEGGRKLMIGVAAPQIPPSTLSFPSQSFDLNPKSPTSSIYLKVRLLSATSFPLTFTPERRHVLLLLLWEP